MAAFRVNAMFVMLIASVFRLVARVSLFMARICISMTQNGNVSFKEDSVCRLGGKS